MVNYHCPRCGYKTLIKTKYMCHLRRKYICNNNNTDDTLNEEYKIYNIIDKIKICENTQKIPVNCDEYTHKTLIKYPKNNNEIINNDSDEDNINKCEYCKKVLSSYKNLWRHLKTCKEKEKDDNNKNMIELVKLLNEQLKEQKEQMKEEKEHMKEEKEQMKEERQILNNQIKEQNSQIKELIKKAGITNSNINIQQNIKLLSYGNTDMSHLTDKDYMKCLNHSNFCVPYLIEQIHFDPQKPENHNIYISNIKNNYVMLYNGKKWILKDRDEAITNLIDDKDVILEQKLEEWIEKGNEYPKIMNKFKRYIDKKDNNKVLNKIKDEIKLVLFNNRGMIDKKQII